MRKRACYRSEISKKFVCGRDEMIETCVPHRAYANTGMSEDETRNMMKVWFPTLKRWK
ncbi:MAG: zinc ribbon domain-containing protein [Oscillospiraceae bacterium]